MERLRKYFVLLGLVSLIGFTGCKQLQPVVTTDTSKTITVTETIRDTTLIVQPDSASIKALFGCDSLNQVYVKQLAVEQGKKIKTEIQWLPGGLMYVTAKIDSQKVYFSWKEKHIHEVDSTKVSKVTVISEKPPWWKRIPGFVISILLLSFLFILFIKIILKRI